MSSGNFKELKAYLQALPEAVPLSSPSTSGSGEDGSRRRHLIHWQNSFSLLICKGEFGPLPSSGRFAQRIRSTGYFPHLLGHRHTTLKTQCQLGTFFRQKSIE